MKNKNLLTRIFMTTLAIFISLAGVFLWPHDVQALDQYSISQPFFDAHWLTNISISTSMTQYGCTNASSAECGTWSGWGIGNHVNFNGSSNHNVTQVHLRTSNNTAFTDSGYEWLVATFTASSDGAMNYDFPLISYQGSTRLVEPISGRRYFFPVSQISTNNWVGMGATGETKNFSQTTVLFHTSQKDLTGQPELLLHLYFPASGSTNGTYFNVSQAIFFNDYSDYLLDQNLKLDEITRILKDIQENGGDSTSQTLNDHREDDQQDMENAQGDASDAGSSSSSDASADGQTLLQAFISFVNAITSASPSNCVITGDLGHLQLGNIDLCTLSPPPAFQAISSIVVIGFAVPLSLAASKKMIELFRSFQN